MEIEDWVMEFIICPKCHADLRADDSASELVCTGCGLAYPVRNSIPVLLVDEARQTPVPQAPVSQAPVSQAPVSQAPVSQAPVSQAPVSQAPVSQAEGSGG